LTIYIRILGGLGNQLFQYAFGSALEARGHQVKYDLDHYRHIGDYYRVNYNRPIGCELTKIFNVPMDIASPEEIRARFGYIHSNNLILRKIALRLCALRELPSHESIFHPHYLECKEGSYLAGYWQAWQYVEQAKAVLKQRLRFPAIDKPELQSILDRIESTNSVAVHIRRADYLQLSAKHPVLTTDYYNAAAKLVKQHTTNPHYFIFSDDIKWASENIHFANMEIVEINRVDDSYRDMQLMSACKSLIIANSSFSWWGAWLNKHENPFVVAPKTWVNLKHELKDIWLPSWVVI